MMEVTESFEVEDRNSSTLVVLNVKPLILENGEAHRTSKYELMNRGEKKSSLIIRRGQAFYLSLTLSKNYDQINDGLSMIFTLDSDKKPSRGAGTLMAIPVLNTEGSSSTSWQAIVEKSFKNKIRIKITTDANACIGKWKLEIDTKNKQNGDSLSFSVKKPFYLIFNPWCPADAVYMPNENERTEYILEDLGINWQGTSNCVRPYIWQYSQFEKNILDCSFYLMSVIGGVRDNLRNDPIWISRCLSAAINSNDDNGVIVGNWSENYQGGKEPTFWLGSKQILQEYYQTKKPVRYGQCWVYAGVLATVCRALGLPCRVITNFCSAHDSQNSLTVDIFVDGKGKIIDELTNDSIWNYHVWNEVWMKRNDLGSEYSGWQVIDATPQELSDGYFQCGPASVLAIKRGEIQKPYDNGFIYAEVNADTVYWRYNGPSKPLKLMDKNIHEVGQMISTKAVGSWKREDITDNYKFPEKSTEERDIMLKALRHSESEFSRFYLNQDFNNIKFDFDLQDDFIIGESFNVRMHIKNVSNEECNIALILRVDAVNYTGKVGDEVKKMSWKNLILIPNNTETVDLPVSWDEYSPTLLNDSVFRISCLATVHETDYEYFAQNDIRVEKPGIIIKILNKPIVGHKLKGTAEFRNPLPIPLNEGTFTIEGPGLTKPLNFKLSQPIQSGESAKCTFSLTPTKAEEAIIVACFHSENLKYFSGFKKFRVKGVSRKKRLEE